MNTFQGQSSNIEKRSSLTNFYNEYLSVIRSGIENFTNIAYRLILFVSRKEYAVNTPQVSSMKPTLQRTDLLKI